MRQNILNGSFLAIVFGKTDKTDDTQTTKLTLRKVDRMHLSNVIPCIKRINSVNSARVHFCKIRRLMQINSSPYHLGFLSCVETEIVDTRYHSHFHIKQQALHIEANAISILKFIDCFIVDGQRKRKIDFKTTQNVHIRVYCVHDFILFV